MGVDATLCVDGRVSDGDSSYRIFWDQVSETYLVDLFRILEALRRRVLPGLSLTSIRTAVSEQLSLYGPSQASWSITSRLNSPRGFGGY